MFTRRRTVFFVIPLVFSVAYSQDCTTPSGSRSNCMSLESCPPLLTAFQNRPVPTNVVTFLRQSHNACGLQYAGHLPIVCCGQVPNGDSTPTPTRRPVPFNEPSSDDDSVPSPPGECGIGTTGDRIFGGNVTEIDEFPWMALMGYRSSTGRLTFQCGGVLINHRYVLTAAHCIKGAIETKVGTLEVVRLGEYDTSKDIDCTGDVCADPPQNIRVEGAYAHPGYADRHRNKRHDIGLVRLVERATFNYYVKPICLPDGRTRLDPGNEVFVAGWGRTLESRKSDVKLKLSLPLYDKTQCTEVFRPTGAILTSGQICAGGNFGQDACQGDSGGPLMMAQDNDIWTVVGVVSFGAGCGRDGWPGVYTSVPSYQSWVLETMASTST